MSSGLCRITDVQKQGGKKARPGPIIVNFEHGKLNPERYGDFSANLDYSFPDEASGDKRKKPNIELTIKGQHLDYSNAAKSVGGCASSDHLVTYIGVRDKETNTMRLVEANVITVGAEVSPPESTNPMLLTDKSKEAEGEDMRAKRMEMKKHLVKSFGQAKGQRIYEQSDRMAVESDALQSKLSSAAMSVDDEKLAMPGQAPSLDLTPPCNRNAGTVHGVYNLDDIISQEECGVLSDAADELKENYKSVDDVSKAVKMKLFSKMFGSILEREFDRSNSEILGIALYIEGLLKLLLFRVKDMKSGPKALPLFIPAGLRSKIFATFTEDSRLTPELRDRCLCYIIILALKISNYSVELNTLMSSVRTKADHLKKLANVVGASIHADSLTGYNHIVLRLPLATFDTNRFSRPKKNK